ncbi:MAG: AAA family ATPase [Betaproteobacteria bacterium]|nr:AAA family ATPase [Betaproteobacteria bacterium]
MEAVILIADLQPIYSVAEVERASEDGAAKRNEGLKSWYDACASWAAALHHQPSTTAAVDDLADASPNFTDVIGDLRKSPALAISGHEAVQFLPMLLLASPARQDAFPRSVSHRRSAPATSLVSMNSLTAGWVLTGASSQWNHARPARRADAGRGGVREPGDRARRDRQGGRRSPLRPDGRALTRCSERDTAAHFWRRVHRRRHGRLAHPVDRHGERRAIPDPILNRMNVYAIDRPDAEGSRRIALAVYCEIPTHTRWLFPSEPSGRRRRAPAAMPARDMKKLLLDAFGTARRAGRDHLEPEDIDAEEVADAARVGFCPGRGRVAAFSR